MSRVLLLCLLAVLASNARAEESLKAKVFVRGEPQKWGQKMVVPDDWAGFVAKSRERLELPADKYPNLRFFDIEDFEVRNIEEMINNMHLFIDLSGEQMPPSLRPDQLHTFPNPLLQQQMGLEPDNGVSQQQPAAASNTAAAPQMGQATDQQFGAVNAGGGADRGALLVSLPVQVLDNGKLRVEQVELYERDDADDVARVFCINHRIGDPECAKLLEALKQRRAAAVGA
jgi:hypothetical protein